MPVGIYKHHKNQGYQKGHKPFVDNRGSKNGMYGKVPWNKKESIKKECGFCKKVFFVNPFRENIAKFCSHSCCAKAHPHLKPFPKGIIPWNKGNPYLKIRGKNHPNWKGGISKISKLERVKFRQQIQKLVFERDNYTCQMCGKSGVVLQVDHIQSWAEYVELRFSLDNCRTLCMRCHYFVTFDKPIPKTVKTWGRNFLIKKIC